MHMKKIKILLSGIGGYGNLYVNSLLPLHCDENSDIEIAGFVDPYPQSCRSLDKISALKFQIYPGMEEFYSDHPGVTVDLTVISSPIMFHSAQICTALEHGSHVLCEKPLCGDTGDIPKMIQTRDRSGKFVSVGYQWSHSEAIQRLKQDILSGRYGKPLFLKTLILWPRDEAYYQRGCGWAGKIRTENGDLVYDSVANNATAHYLHNIFYVLGTSAESSMNFQSVEASLSRANAIENFDTCAIKGVCENGAGFLFVASHAVDKSYGPVFEYTFEKGKIVYSDKDQCIKAVLHGGEEIIYGNPNVNDAAKLFYALDIIRNGSGKILCGIEAASVQSYCIRSVQDNCEIENFPKDKIYVTENKVTAVRGLFDRLMQCYEKETLLYL